VAEEDDVAMWPWWMSRKWRQWDGEFLFVHGSIDSADSARCQDRQPLALPLSPGQREGGHDLLGHRTVLVRVRIELVRLLALRRE
jgi:hypothetical protein